MHVTRRHIMFGFAAGAAAAGSVEAAQRSSPSSDTDRGTMETLRDIAAQLRSQGDPPILATIREAQRSFLRANQRFPEYLEVGIAVWEQLYDWHVHTGQAIQVVRVPDGRYGMVTLMSTLVLHVGAQPGYVGPGNSSL